MRPIVSPTDFSDLSINAVNYAADLACALGANLALLHVYSMPVAFSEVPYPAFNVEELAAQAENQIALLKKQLIQRTGDKIKIITETRQGSVVFEIEQYCSLIKPFAVVMGSEKGGPLERFLLGGRTISAISQLSWPLIIVPPKAEFRTIRKIAMACDFREVISSIPAKEIAGLVQQFQAEFHVLHVSNEAGDSYSDKTIEESAWFQDMLGDLHPKYHFVKSADIDNSINEYAEKNNLDLLIVVPKEHNLVDKIFHHSHSKRVALHTHVPVMAIHE